MTTLREAAQLALEALEALMNYSSPHGLSTVVLTLRKALADQSEQALGMVNPVAWLGFNPRTGDPELANAPPAPSVLRDFTMRPLVYGDTSAPPQRKPLTDEEIAALAIDEDGLPNSHFEFARAIERAHGIGGEE